MEDELQKISQTQFQNLRAAQAYWAFLLPLRNKICLSLLQEINGMMLSLFLLQLLGAKVAGMVLRTVKDSTKSVV